MCGITANHSKWFCGQFSPLLHFLTTPASEIWPGLQCLPMMVLTMDVENHPINVAVSGR